MNFHYTREVSLDEIDQPGVVVIGAVSAGEDRATWWSNYSKARTFTLTPIGNPVMEFKWGGREYQVRNKSHLQELLVAWAEVGEIYIDITTLPYEIWAALIRRSLLDRVNVRAVYVEPKEYSKKSKQDIIRQFELCDEIMGISNLPGFSHYVQDDEPFGLIVPLGFEGARFGYLLEKVEAESAGTVIPLIGVPGFRPEFVRYAYEANLQSLERTGFHRSIRFARANCPFSVYYQICVIAKEIPEGLIKFGLIGTRPHSLGIVLYSILSNRKTSLLFDFPTRRSGRSKGVGKVLVYEIGRFREEVRHVS